MSTVTILAGDNRISLRRLIDQGVRVHSVVCDPPYGLVSVTKRFGKEGSAPARKEGNDGSFGRLSAGFMGKAWDGTGIERDPEFWRLVYDILLPGGLVFAFSGSRTGHWQACAMELAGFIHHPTHYWVFGSGFPKAHDAARAIDQHVQFQGSGDAEDWIGWKFGTQSQKPAAEPIYLCQKPFSERTCAANLLKHGVGAFNVDDCRVPTVDDLNGGAYAKNPTARAELWGQAATSNEWVRGGAGDYVQPEGRYPSNLILDGSPEVVAMFPDSKGQMGDLKDHGNTRQSPNGVYNGMRPALDHPARGDSGSAARFFHQFPRYICDTCQDAGWITEGAQTELIQVSCPDCAGACRDPITAAVAIYNAKAGKIDRAGGKHPTVKPIALMQYLIRHITPKGGIVLDPFAGSGTTGVAAQKEGFDCILMEAEPEYVDFLNGRFAPEIGDVGKLYLTALGF